MDKLISRSAPLFPTKYRLNDTDYAKGWNDCLSGIMQQPAVDAVPVVRCGKCRNFKPFTDYLTGKQFNFGSCYHWREGCDGELAEVTADDFCSYGDRKEIQNEA